MTSGGGGWGAGAPGGGGPGGGGAGGSGDGGGVGAAARRRAERRSEPERLEAFSDGVLAVIITIMALELKAPAEATAHALGQRVPGLLVYVLSFAFVGIYWNNHHQLLRSTGRISGAVMWANLHLLFWLSLIPVLTEWVGESYRASLPASMYGVVGLLAGVAYTILVRTIIAANGSDSDVARAIGRDRKGWISLGLYSFGIGISWLSPYVAYGAYAAVSVMWFIPDRRLESVAARDEAGDGDGAPGLSPG